jgi:hypothetical protein
VKKRPVKDVAASVRQKLLNHAKSTNRPFQEVLQYFAMERFLYRLAQSPHAHQFILKGALLFTVWGAPSSRATKDIDFLAKTKNTIDAVLPLIRSICTQSTEPDGLIFDAESVQGTRIKEDADYEGIRVTFQATLQNACIAMQLDLGYGDVMVPGPIVAEYPAILDLPVPRLRMYSRETVIAEKFEAMVKLGQLNSRLKDFFDLWLLSRQFDFDGAILATAIAKTFANRKTLIPAEVLPLSLSFADDAIKQTQWKGFLKKSRLENAPADFHDVIGALGEFLQPVATAVRQSQPFPQSWSAPGPWKVG